MVEKFIGSIIFIIWLDYNWNLNFADNYIRLGEIGMPFGDNLINLILKVDNWCDACFVSLKYSCIYWCKRKEEEKEKFEIFEKI